MDSSLLSPWQLTGKSRFTAHLIRENGLQEQGFEGWLFHPGMLFNAADTWWGRKGKRTRPHEGLDLCFYKDGQGSVLRLQEGSRVPAIYDGAVVKIIDDFLGKSVIVEHRLPSAPGRALIAVYGHTVPGTTCPIGAFVRAGESIATIAGPGASRRDIHPHLHLSLGWLSGTIPRESLTWENMSRGIFMVDPLHVIDGPSSTLQFP